MGTYARILSRMTLDSRQFTSEMRRIQREAELWVRRMKTVGRDLSLSFSAPAAAGAALALNSYKEYDALKRALATQETSVASLTARLEELRLIARNPGIGFQEAIQGDVRLRAIGISAGQSARILREFANAIAQTGGGKRELNQVTVQLGQMAAKGQVFAQDLKPIIEAAPVVGNALRNMFGVVDSESIQKILKETGKDSKEFISDLLDELAKAPRVSGGFKNAVENMEDALFQFGASVGEGIDNTFDLTGKLESLSTNVVQLGNKFRELPPALQKVIVGVGGAATAFGPLLYVTGKLSETFIGNGGFARGLELFKAFGKAIGENWKVSLKWAVVLTLIVENWDNIVSFVREGADNFNRLYKESLAFKTVVDLVAETANYLVSTLKLGLGVLGDLAKLAGGVLLTTLRAAGGLMEEIITGKKVKYKDPFKELRGAWDSLIQRVDIYRQKAQGIATTEDIKKGIDRLKNSMVESKKAIADLLNVGKKEKTPNIPGGDEKKISDYQKAVNKYNEGLESIKRKTEAGVPGFDALDEKIKVLSSSINSFAEISGKDGSKAIKWIQDLSVQLGSLKQTLDAKEFSEKVSEINKNFVKLGKNFIGSGKSAIKQTEDQIKLLQDAMEELNTDIPEQAEQWKVWAEQVDKLQKSLENVSKSKWTVVVDFDGTEKFFDQYGTDITKNVESFKKIIGKMWGGDQKEKKKSKNEWDKDVEEIQNKVEKVVGQTQNVSSQLFGVADAYFTKKYAKLDEYYAAEKAKIESSQMSEEAKKAAIDKLDEDTAKKKRKIARDEAKVAKAKAIFEATINGISAAVKALTAGPVLGPILAGVIGSLAAAQVALIASTPLPALAKGGLAFGPQLALVGDNRAAQTDPEVIAPLSRLKSYLKNDQGPQFLYSVVRGSDLHLISERNKVISHRTR